MTRHFLSHLHKSFSRSSSYGKDASVQVMLGIIVLMMVGYSLLLAFSLERIILNALHQNDAVRYLNSVLIYYFISGFMTRYFVQSLPVMDVQPYLHLPINKSSIINFLIGKSLFSVFNVYVFLLFTPFALGPVAKMVGVWNALSWLLCLWLISLINHFLVIIVKRYAAQNVWSIVILLAIGLGLVTLDYFELLKVTTVSATLFGMALQGGFLVVILFLLVFVSYFIVYQSYSAGLYPVKSEVSENVDFYSGRLDFLQRFGLVGTWTNVELKLIFRNKRSRELFLMHMLFLLLPLGFYSTAKQQDAYGALLFFSLISSGFFSMNYGMYLFSWQGSHYDFILNQPTPIREFVASRYWLMAILTASWFLFSIPYVYFGWKFLLINLATTLFNIGVNSFIVMNMSMWGVKKIDLKHSGAINLEGVGAAQWLMGIPLMAGPYLFYLPFALAGYPIAGILCVAFAGLAGLVLHKLNIDVTTARLVGKRYLMAENFRKD